MDNVEAAFHRPYKFLKEITGGFSDECLLGSGTYGKVYKGKDKDGQEIAVKLLKSMDLDGNEFARELNNLTKLKHPNIVRLVGFCDEEEKVVTDYNGKNIIATQMHRALCLEYLNNGSLQKHLSDEHHVFDWQKRYKIIKGVCMGLKYLHEELESPVHHLDLKPDNILLDSNMEPKIADFGLCRLLGEKTSKSTMSTVGTLGYCPPEFINNQIISKEFDIFSLGVIIIKIICGPAVHSPDDGIRPIKFVRQVHKKWRGRLRAVPGHASLEADCQQVKKCIEIALKCTDKDRRRRPNIGYIVDQLADTEIYKNDKAYLMDESQQGLVNTLTKELPATLMKEVNVNFVPEREFGRSAFGTDYKEEVKQVVHQSSKQERLPRIGSTLPKDLPATFMKEITNGFSPDHELGRTAFGKFYKGVLPEGGGGMIAVKRLSENASELQGTFAAEVTNLMGLMHENIAELVHYCHEAHKNVVQRNGRYVIEDVIESCLCYEYLPNGSLDNHLYADTMSIIWDTRFKIIRGICQGIHFLHMDLVSGPLVHMNLAPNSIWLDDNWVPKIADFGLSRLFGQEQTRMYTVNVKGYNGYMAPEYLYRGEISTMSDIYSLGMLILEITTGEKNCGYSEDRSARNFVTNVHENWKTNEQIIHKYPSLDPNGLQQVRACIVIGLKCVEADRNKRPSIVDIVLKLNGKRVPMFEQISEGETKPLSNVLLDVYPAQLRIPFKPDKLSSCPLRLTNVTDDYIAARLRAKNKRRYNSEMPLYAVVPPRATYTLVVTMREQKNQSPLDTHELLSLESRIFHEGVGLENADLDSAAISFSNSFKESKELRAHKQEHEMTLSVAFYSPEEATPDRPFWCGIEIIPNKNFSEVMSVDLHPTEPWILTSHKGGDIFIWDYKELEIESRFDFTQRPVYSAKFIERKEWFVAGDGDGFIYVYNYETDEKVTSIEAHEDKITSLAVHPSDPIVISSSDDHLIKLWNWEKGWECARIFEGHSDRVTQVNINPINPNSFASASADCTIKIWNIVSSESKITLSSEHQDRLLCVQNYTSYIHQYLITGSCDGTAHIWDLETETCVQTLKGHTNRIGSVYRHPEIPVLITGSHDGTVRLWDCHTYRYFSVKYGFNSWREWRRWG
ncbi:hypothetical protein PVAP13_8NG173301 [Panicum virgatum]|uniref:Uncharacterized protein n=1 Tax=Panicum virgatum TaxID=38727 RepID=A0A8T0PEJ4_PANVG|nr:hypothetical protein PVAP13_8NG173301 [Panicum virgatum]